MSFPVVVMERRCGGCHGSPPNTKPVIGKGMYFTFGGAGPPLPLVHDFADLKKIRGAMGYFKFGRSRTPQSLCNLTRAGKSLLVQAPLSENAGGLGLCDPIVFADTSDPDYQTILSAITEASREHQITMRFDMPDFRPNDHYIIQMQRFGALPDKISPDEPIDIYATDQAYWRSHWYRPASQ